MRGIKPALNTPTPVQLIVLPEMDALFCPQCKSILDIPADEDFIACSVCGERQAASGKSI